MPNVMPLDVEYKALKVSAPEPVVLTSAPFVRGKMVGAAVVETAAYVPVAVPAVCDRACELAAFWLKVVAAAPYVASAVMLEKSFSMAIMVAPALATPPPAVN